MERDTDQGSKGPTAPLTQLNGTAASADARPDWDPYAVWLTHIMKTPEPVDGVNPDTLQHDSVRTQTAQQDTGNHTTRADQSWNPYAVWQSLIKS
ncbi:MAG: hypothetical protein AAFN78_16215 [Pseudomonadota bacterium]